MPHRVLYGETSRTLEHVPHMRVSAATYVIEDMHRSIDDSERELASGAATVASLSLTTDDVAGAGEADPRRIPVASTAGASIGDPCVLVAADGTTEAVVIDAIAAGDYITADRELTGRYASGSTLLGVKVTAPFPDDAGRDDDYTDHGTALRVVWAYQVGGRMTKVQEQVRMVRHDTAGDLSLAAVEQTCVDMFPDLKNRMPTTDPGQLRRWIDIASRMVQAEFRRRKVDPLQALHGDDVVLAVAYQTLIIAGQNSACPADMSSQDFIDQMRAELKNVLGAMTHGEPGEDTADLERGTDTATARRATRYSGVLGAL